MAVYRRNWRYAQAPGICQPDGLEKCDMQSKPTHIKSVPKLYKTLIQVIT